MNQISLRWIQTTDEVLRVTFEQFKTSLLMGLGTALVGIAGFMATSVSSLNEKMAVVVSSVTRHESEIRDLRALVIESERVRLLVPRKFVPKEYRDNPTED